MRLLFADYANIILTRPSIIQIDVDMLFDEFGPDRPDYRLFTLMHPDISGVNKLLFYWQYLTSFSLEAIKVKLQNNLNSLNRLDYSIEKGYWSRPNRDKMIDANCTNYFAKEDSFHANVINRNAKLSHKQSQNLRKNLETIGEIKKLCQQHGVRVTFYLSPYHRAVLDTINLTGYLEFLSKMVTISPVINFTYYSDQTMDSCNYYESSHYRSALAKETMHSVFSLGNGEKSFFGRRVSGGNLALEKKFLIINFGNNRFKRQQD